MGDAFSYWSNGAIVDRRGYVVSPDMHMGVIAARLLGFYPADAAKQYDAIRLSKRINNYQKEMVATYRYAAVKAHLSGNLAYEREIYRAVEDWNRSARGTGLEMKEFEKNTKRAIKEAKMSATQRTLRSTAKAARDDTSSLIDAILQ
jgi:hypothetical protein